MKKSSLAILSLALLAAAGCNGPVRYKALGYRSSATVELLEGAPWYLAPLAAAPGIVFDAGVLVLDTAASPFTGGLCFRGDNAPLGSWGYAWPLGFPAGMAALPFLGESAYYRLFGQETGMFADRGNGGSYTLSELGKGVLVRFQKDPQTSLTDLLLKCDGVWKRLGEPASRINAVALTPNGSFLSVDAVGADGKAAIQLYDLATGEAILR